MNIYSTFQRLPVAPINIFDFANHSYVKTLQSSLIIVIDTTCNIPEKSTNFKQFQITSNPYLIFKTYSTYHKAQVIHHKQHTEKMYILT